MTKPHHIGSVIKKILIKHNKKQNWLTGVWNTTRASVSSQLQRPTIQSEKLILLARALDLPITVFFPEDLADPRAFREMMKSNAGLSQSKIEEMELVIKNQKELLKVMEENSMVAETTIKQLEFRISMLEKEINRLKKNSLDHDIQ